MEERRGRPKEGNIGDKPRQFFHTFKDDDGMISIWTYDLDKFPNGPISVVNEYPEDYKFITEEEVEDQSLLPITKRKFLNQENGKFVGYNRAKQLGII